MNSVRSIFSRHPVLGNTFIYGCLYAGAEFFQQTFNKKIMIPEGSKPEDFDTGTLARYGIMGTCVFPHTLYHAYKYLDRKFPGASTKMALSKLAIDSLIVTPANLTLFYVGMSTMERKEDVLAEWKEKIIPTFVTASVFWVPAQLINFKLLPPQFRVVFVGSCQIIWVSILCWFKRQDFSKDKKEGKEDKEL